MIETKLWYSEPLLREAVRVFFFRTAIRQYGVSFFVGVTALVATSLAFLISHHDRGRWFVGFLFAWLLFLCIFLANVYVAQYRHTIGAFRRMRTPEATFACDENQFTLTSNLDRTTMPWSSVREIWRRPRFWLLIHSETQFVILPLDGLDEQTQAFITRNVEEANAPPTED